MNQPIHVLDLVDKKKLDEILRVFTEVTNIASIISDADGKPITEPHNFTNLCQNYCRSTEEGIRRCCESDRHGGRESARLRRCVVYNCLNAGLLDAASPIIVGGKHLANILCGQVLEKPLKTEIAVERARAIGITNIKGYRKALAEIPIMSRERFRLIVNLMEVITQTVSELALEKYLSHKRSQLYLDKLINSVSECIISTDVDGMISMINEAGIDMFSREAKKLIGLPIHSLFSNSDSINEYQKQVHVRSKERGHLDLMAINARGEEIPIKMSLSRILDETNEKSGYVAVLRDISEEKKVEQIKEDLIGMLTHDMGNPVLSIQKAIKIMVDETVGPLNRRQKELMRLSLGTSHQLFRMVNDFLDIYRSENGRLQLNMHLIDMNKVLERSIHQVNFFAQDKHITIRFEPSALSLRIVGDENRLIRTCVNLLDNAIKYSPKGGEVTVSATVINGNAVKTSLPTIGMPCVTTLQPERRYLITSVSDRGLGIPKKYQQSIFDKFFKVNIRNGNNRGGVGLGLAFCKQVTEAHGGCVWVKSPIIADDGTKHNGCRFQFISPVNPDT
jgi:PAS domain S-box-containing protein